MIRHLEPLADGNGRMARTVGHLAGIVFWLSTVLTKTNFWRQWADTLKNERQIKLINKLRDDFDGKLTTNKGAAIAKGSTAQRSKAAAS